MDKGAVPRRGEAGRACVLAERPGSGLLQPIGPSSPQTAPGRAGHSNPQGSATSARLRQGRLPERNKVERLIGRLKQYRRIATRYEKRAANYLAMVTLGMTMLWLT